MAIYGSRMSEPQTDELVLDIVLRTCAASHYALVDLVKRHYLLVWMTGALSATAPGSQGSLGRIMKLVELFNVVWNKLGQVGSSSKKSSEKTEVEESDEQQTEQVARTPPLTFLNQMYGVAMTLVHKLRENSRPLLASLSASDENKTAGGGGQWRSALVELFKAKKQLLAAMTRSAQLQHYDANNNRCLSDRLLDLLRLDIDQPTASRVDNEDHHGDDDKGHKEQQNSLAFESIIRLINGPTSTTTDGTRREGTKRKSSTIDSFVDSFTKLIKQA